LYITSATVAARFRPTDDDGDDDDDDDDDGGEPTALSCG
jgi:hypothetical protein